MNIITDIIGREILDSRGNPTVEVDLFVDNNKYYTSSVPSGASTGLKEAIELRDKDEKRYNGNGVTKAVNNINTIIKNTIVGCELNQELIDKKLIELDGTENKKNLGANSILAVSISVLKALSDINGKEVYEYISDGNVSLPIPMMNIINGGKHSDNNLDIQEFMIVPIIPTFKERLRAGSEVFHTLKKILKEKGLSTGVGDEGGFAPELKNNNEALELIMEAIKQSNYIPGKDIYIALDIAASSFFIQSDRMYLFNGKVISKNELMDYYLNIIEKYPIVSIEDPFYEDDFISLQEITKKIGNITMIVGDDYFVTNEKYLKKGIEEKAANAILIKPNQVGTILETINTINLAKQNNIKTIISHRSGETEDSIIADLAVGLDLKYIKTGSLSRGERISKYNRLLRIEERLLKM